MSVQSIEGTSVAIIGVGRMGVRHAEAAEKLGMRIVGIADVSADAVAAARDQFGVPESGCATDPLAMLEAVRPEAVVVATTAPAHAALVLKAVETGAKYILCEKPLAASLAEADAMIAACKAAGAVFAVNHQMRFMPNYTQVKDLIGSAELGPLVSVIVAGSNFGLAMNASHYFEAFRYLTDGPVAAVQAWLEQDSLTNPRGAQFDDRSGRLLARGASGATMYMDFSADAGWGLQTVYICRFGQIFVDELHGTMRVAAREEQYRDLPTSRYGMPAVLREEAIAPVETVAPTMAVWRAMFAGSGYPSGEDGAHALQCLVAAHASHRQGGVAVALDSPDLPRDKIFHWA